MYTISKDPILSLDMSHSEVPPNSHATGSIVTIAGWASDALTQSELPVSDRGTIALIKSTWGMDTPWSSRIRLRLSTCSLDRMSAGKQGVDVCRFRPDGRLFAVGGWDKRLRIFDRAASSASTSPLALLKAHTASVCAVDWAPDAPTSGLLATGAADGQICIWRCYPK
jgi:WD40 repeat protein